MTSGIGVAANAETAEAVNSSGGFVKNGTFEKDSTGWHTNKGARLAAVPGDNSLRAVAMSNIASKKQTVVLNDKVNSVKSTIAGHTYQATARVRAAAPSQSVVLRLLEWDGANGKNGVERGRKLNHDWVTTNKWQSISVDYTAKTTGSSLDLNVLAYDLPNGKRVEIDNVTLVDLNQAPAAEQPSPTVEPRPLPEVEAPAETAPETAPEPGPETDQAPVAPAGWSLAWNDEFNGNTVDSNKWNVLNNSTYGDGNKELACLMDRPENVNVSDGSLKITARAESKPIQCGSSDERFPNGRSYTSGHMETKGKASFQYGRFEVSAKTPNAHGESKGLWPAFWLRPAGGGIGEIDVFEIIGTAAHEDNTANRVSQTIHYDYVKTHPMQTNGYNLPSGDFSDGFHTYAVEWEPGSIKWFVDDVLTYERNTSTTSWLDDAFSRPFIMRLNMAVGGTWPGSPDADTQFPADFEVDYVRVYQRP